MHNSLLCPSFQLEDLMPPPTEAGHRKQLGPHLPGAVPSTLPNSTFTSTLAQGLEGNGPGGSCKERGRLGEFACGGRTWRQEEQRASCLWPRTVRAVGGGRRRRDLLLKQCGCDLGSSSGQPAHTLVLNSSKTRLLTSCILFSLACKPR